MSGAEVPQELRSIWEALKVRAKLVSIYIIITLLSLNIYKHVFIVNVLDSCLNFCIFTFFFFLVLGSGPRHNLYMYFVYLKCVKDYKT